MTTKAIPAARDPRPANLCKRRALRIGSLLFLIALLAAGTPLLGQRQQKPDISVEVKLVNVLATVRDSKGQIVRNLTKDDFILDEDGRPQTIQYFSQESDLPLTLGLLVDTSMSQVHVLPQERTASYSFLDHMLREDKDQDFVIHFDREVELLQDLTASRSKLEASLELLDVPARDSGGGYGSGGNGRGQGGSGGGDGRRGGFGGAGTLLYDAIYLASNEVMKPLPGRKAEIILSDGVDRGSRESIETAIESAQRADTLIFSILFKGEEPGGGHGGFAGPRIGMGGPGGWPGSGGEAAEDILASNAQTVRRFSSACRRKPAAGCSKSPKRSQSTKSTPASKRIYATSIASAIPPINPNPDTARYIWPRRTKI